MDTMLLEVFKREVERQCKFALIAYQDLEKALQTKDTDRIWFSIQNFLSAAGMVSKLLWPTDSKIPDRGPELRRILAIDDDSPLALRTFRNHFEHFDARLEAWATSSERHNFFDANLGSLDRIAGADPTDFLRNFDPTSFAVTYRGDMYYLRPVVEAIGDLWQKSNS